MLQVSSLLTTSAVVVTAGLWYLGVFRKIRIVPGEIGPETFVHVKGTGPYSSVGGKLSQVIENAKKHGFRVKRAAGLYYDDPKVTPKTELRWCVGFLIENDETELLKTFDLEPLNLQVKKLSTSKTGVGIFPNVCPPLSYMVAAMKVYPVFAKQSEFKVQCGAFEVYNFSDWSISIHFPQENFQEFMPVVPGDEKKTST